MKKLMFAAALAACATGAFADDTPCTREEVEVFTPRVYQIEMKVNTTRGVALGESGIGATQCDRGTTACIVHRGKDKTLFRGYVYVCNNFCDMKEYACVLADVRRNAAFRTGYDAKGEALELKDVFTWNVLNIMGAKNTDAEANWEFGTISSGAPGTDVFVDYDSATLAEEAVENARVQSYYLCGSGYGKFNQSSLIYDQFTGYFAGVASASFDLTTKLSTAVADCICSPSKVLTCSTFGELDFQSENTIAFGSWKLRYNVNVTKAYNKGDWGPIQAVRKLYKNL